MKRKHLAFVLVFAVFLSVLSSCKPSKTESPSQSSNIGSTTGSVETTSPTSTETTTPSTTEGDSQVTPTSTTTTTKPDTDSPASVEKMFFDLMTIVYPEKSSIKVEDIASELSIFLSNKYYMNKVVTDKEKPNKEGELLLGNTNRPESKRALEKITANRKNNANDYIIAVDNGNIVINAVSEHALYDAVKYFMNTLCKESASIPKGYSRFYKPVLSQKNGGTIAGVDIKSYVIVTPRDKSFIYSREVDALVDKIRKMTGFAIPVVDDRKAPQAHEILVGPTNRAESEQMPGANQYLVKQVGSKIVVQGATDEILAGAVRALASQVDSSKGAGAFAVKAGLNLQKAYTPGSNDYRLVWGDEFNDAELDLSKWYRYSGHEQPAHGGRITQTVDSPKNVRLENGNLLLECHEESERLISGGGISTAYSMNFLYGYIEIRAKLGKGAGVKPSYWLNGDKLERPGGFGEIDIFEMFGTSNKIVSNLHKWWYEYGTLRHVDHGGSGDFDVYRAYTLPDGEAFGDAYHTFGCEWTPEYVAFYVDGYKYTQIDILAEGKDVFHQPVFALLTLLTGGTASVPPDETTPWPAQSWYDWIRVYQIPGVGQLNLIS